MSSSVNDAIAISSLLLVATMDCSMVDNMGSSMNDAISSSMKDAIMASSMAYNMPLDCSSVVDTLASVMGDAVCHVGSLFMKNAMELSLIHI